MIISKRRYWWITIKFNFWIIGCKVIVWILWVINDYSYFIVRGSIIRNYFCLFLRHMTFVSLLNSLTDTNLLNRSWWSLNWCIFFSLLFLPRWQLVHIMVFKLLALVINKCQFRWHFVCIVLLNLLSLLRLMWE